MTDSKATGLSNVTLIGSFKLNTYCSLLKREYSWFEEQKNKRILSILPVFELAKKIAAKQQISDADALEIVQKLDEVQHQALLMSFTEEIADIQSKAYSESDFNADVVSMILESRLAKKVREDVYASIKEEFDIDINPEKGWLPEYTEQLPMTLIEEICAFVASEKSGLAKTEPTSTEEPTLGKSLEG